MTIEDAPEVPRRLLLANEAAECPVRQHSGDLLMTLFASEGGAPSPAASSRSRSLLRRRLLGVLGHELDVESQALQFLHEHVEGLRGTRLEAAFSLHDCLVDPVA